MKCDSTIALRVHNYSYSATFIGKDMVLGTVEPCELVPTGHFQGSGSEQEEEKFKSYYWASGHCHTNPPNSIVD